jgi:hypothetical protein
MGFYDQADRDSAPAVDSPMSDSPTPAESSAGKEHVDAVVTAVRGELDEVIPHVVSALKRHDATTELANRLDAAEKRLAEREQRPLIAGLRRVLITARRLDFDPKVKEAIVGEMERLLIGAGYTEFGEVGESFDPVRHEAITGGADAGSATVVEVYEPGLETLGETVVRARVKVAPSDANTPASEGIPSAADQLDPHKESIDVAGQGQAASDNEGAA